MKKAWYAFWMLMAAVVLLPAAGLARPAQGRTDDGQGQAHDRVSIKLNYWIASYGGETKVAGQDVFGGTATIKGDRLDLANDLGIENPQGVPEIAVWVRLGIHHRILVSYFAARYEGDKHLKRNVDIGGFTFIAASDLDTTFEFSRVTLMHQWNPLMSDRGRLGLQWGGEYYDWKFSYEGTEVNTGVKESDSATVPIFIPVVGLDGQLVLGYGISLYGSVSGIGANFGGFQAGYTDVNAGLAYDYQMLHVDLGYRTIDTRLKGKDGNGQKFDSSFNHSGLLISLGLNI